jgi:hypothetical protein
MYETLVQLLLNSGWGKNAPAWDWEIVGKVEKNTFVVTVQVNYLAYVETYSPKYRVFCILIRQTYSVTSLTTDSQMLLFLLGYFWIVTFTIKTLFM